MCRNIELLEKAHDTLKHMKIGFVGGASGGHFYPLIAVAKELHKDEHEPQLYYFGPFPYDEEALGEHGVKYVYCPAGKLRRYFSIQNIIIQ